MPGRPLPALTLAGEEKAVLEDLASGDAPRQALRARIILACTAGRTNEEVAAALGTSVQTIGKWRRRFLAHRLDGLDDRPRAGVPRTIDDSTVEAIVVRAVETKPPGSARWSSRLMAKATGVSASTVQRVWRAFGLRPHRAKRFALSADPRFVDRVRDILGLYLDRPDRALVLCVDERQRSVAIDGPSASAAVLRARARLASLFVALDRATGRTVDVRYPQLRHDECRHFIDDVGSAALPGLDLYVVVYGDGSRDTAMIRDWRARRPLDRIHVAPTYAAWLNHVERWSALLAERELRCGSEHGAAMLQSAIASFIDRHRSEPAPFCWTHAPHVWPPGHPNS